MKKSMVIGGGLALAIFAALAWFHFVKLPAMIAEGMANSPRPLITVSAAAAEQRTWRPTLSAIGTLRAINGIDIAAEVSGRVSEISFESGQTVEQGAALIKIDDSVEQADLKSSLASLANARLVLARGQELNKKGDYPQANVDRDIAARDQAAAAVERTRALIEKKNIRAPFAGRIGIRQVDDGEYIEAGKAIVTLQALDPIYVDFSMPERHLGRFEAGSPVMIEVDAAGGIKTAGKITSVDARVNRETRNILVQATLPNPDERLLPGMFADVRVGLPEKTGVITVPQTGIAYSLYGDAVYVLAETEQKAPDGSPVYTVHRRFVQTGDVQRGIVEIREGLAAGEMIVTSGQLKLQDGMQVTVNNSVRLSTDGELKRQ